MWKYIIPVCKNGPYRHQRGACHFTRRTSYDQGEFSCLCQLQDLGYGLKNSDQIIIQKVNKYFKYIYKKTGIKGKREEDSECYFSSVHLTDNKNILHIVHKVYPYMYNQQFNITSPAQNPSTLSLHAN